MSIFRDDIIDEIYRFRMETENVLNTIFKAWLNEAGLKSVQLKTKRESNKIVCMIYTNKPGYLIGYHGQLIKKYKAQLAEFYACEPDDIIIKFEETNFLICV